MIKVSYLCYWVISILISAFFTKAFSQNKFEVENDKGKFRQKFDLVNDLVIVPVEVNGREMSFLLDTGVSATILFSFTTQDSTSIKNPSIVYIKGMGVGKPLKALKSNHNTIKIGDAVSRDHSMYLIGGKVFDISNRLGFALNGIIGYDFFKDLVVEFNYKRKFMWVHDKDLYVYEPCKRCEDLPLQFFRKKPYLPATISIEGRKNIEVDLLLDSGSGDALWLFEDRGKDIYLPAKSFEDFLGFGINGSVYGHRSRIHSISLGDYSLEEVTVSYPDSIALARVDNFDERDGSLGAQVFKRFHSVVDYGNRNLRLKSNTDFKKPFEYNMSGVVVKHEGFRVVKNQVAPSFKIQDDDQNNGTQVFSTTREVLYSLEPNYEVAEIRPDSPAELSGLQAGDAIISINGRPAYKFTLNRIYEVFSSKEGRRIRMEISREGQLMEISFRLERML